MKDTPFRLDSLINLTWYVGRDTYKRILEDKSGNDHVLLTEKCRTFFTIQWGGSLTSCLLAGRYLLLSTTPLALWFLISFFSLGLPYSLCIDDRHNGQLQIPPTRGLYAAFVRPDEHKLAAAKAAVFLEAYFLIKLDIFWVCQYHAALSCSIFGFPVRFFSGGFLSYSQEKGKDS